MTKEEANFLRTTISAIESQGKSNVSDIDVGDLISREAAIEDLKGKDPSQIWDTADIEVWINDLPSIPQKTGRWIEKEGEFICSRCGNGYKEQPRLMGKPIFEFCPVCGAKMGEPRESEGEE